MAKKVNINWLFNRNLWLLLFLFLFAVSILYMFSGNYIFFFLFALSIGGMLSICWYQYLKPFGFRVFETSITIFCICLALFSDIVLQKQNKVFARLYEKENPISFESFCRIGSMPAPVVIFALDNSGSMEEKISNDLLDSTFVERFVRFKKTINNIVELNSSDTNATYLNYYKAKLCNDLLSLKGRSATFSLLIIGDEIKKLYCENKTDSLTINQVIKDIYSGKILTNTTSNTDFDIFFNNLNKKTNIPQKDIYEISKYTLCIYSDFEHDTRRKKNSRFRQEIARIQRNREELRNKSALFYMFTTGSSNKENGVYSILRDSINEFENWNTLYSDELIPLQTIFIKSPLAFYYESPYECKEVSTIFTLFNNNEKTSDGITIHLTKNTDIRKQFRLIAEKDTLLLATKPNLIKGNVAEVCYSGHIPTQYPFVELVVEKDRIRYYIEPVFFRELPKFMGWFLPLLLFFIFGSLCVIVQKEYEAYPLKMTNK